MPRKTDIEQSEHVVQMLSDWERMERDERKEVIALALAKERERVFTALKEKARSFGLESVASIIKSLEGDL